MNSPRAETLRRRRTVRVAATSVAGAIVLALVLSAGDERRKPEFAGAAPKVTPTAAAACGARAPAPAGPNSYDEPQQVLEPAADYSAIVHTSCGDIELDLLERTAPVAVNNFVFLAREGFYDGLIWNRVDGNFVIQTGDPNGDFVRPPDGPGYTIPDELPDKPSEYVYGVVAMSQSGVADSAGSQFFIVVHRGAEDEVEPAGLPRRYSIFGKVVESSYETLETISKQPVRAGNHPATAVRPVTPIFVNSIEIIQR